MPEEARLKLQQEKLSVGAIASSEWEAKGCNTLADKDDIDAITKKINGGLISPSERKQWAVKTKQIWS